MGRFADVYHSEYATKVDLYNLVYTTLQYLTCIIEIADKTHEGFLKPVIGNTDQYILNSAPVDFSDISKIITPSGDVAYENGLFQAEIENT